MWARRGETATQESRLLYPLDRPAGKAGYLSRSVARVSPEDAVSSLPPEPTWRTALRWRAAGTRSPTGEVLVSGSRCTVDVEGIPSFAAARSDWEKSVRMQAVQRVEKRIEAIQPFLLMRL